MLLLISVAFSLSSTPHSVSFSEKAIIHYCIHLTATIKTVTTGISIKALSLFAPSADEANFMFDEIMQILILNGEILLKRCKDRKGIVLGGVFL